ncbi:MAG: hypothetical protein ABIG11_01500 [bacterium]
MKNPRLSALTLILASISIFFSSFGCAAHRLDWITVGPTFPKKNWKDIAVYATKEAPGRPWGAIGVIHGQRIRYSDRKAIEKQMKTARKMAAEAGADAIIMTQEEINPTDGSWDRGKGGLFLTGVAISYNVETSTTEAHINNVPVGGVDLR